ncbi:2-oxoglutarate dehydrogenase E1 component [Gluconacetobacter azotocaptans]|uniref:2-oxoglutarate dehydrogenase E1 component n=1 Tax=Gluconacetobacter azotocaptans TaxID=142834 RepID=A0A7W4JUC8_9PROT|nr:2-oxoglutarate dehydrogenase E1 component [Gluconacetobacter azotocaptans]MBB2191091.1 2-oxoglutarate dehydrogenase E1 component [Gluconacetobacter azotocaptans]MBM9402298.1 2-oxoglutarate dehydrogenase E1 component [Gluconacetobacter azotocaptans]GBQ26252.1 2-oxoglutarate dehydrogenase E1 [Gluconacetobacter azotocaptans DSM 13594]
MAGVDILSTAFSGANTAYLAELYARWVSDPGSVDPSFASLFAAMDEEGAAVLHDAEGASWSPRLSMIDGGDAAPVAAKGAVGAPASVESLHAAADDSLRATQLIRAYRVRGHLEARLDPLGLQIPKPHADLDPATYGFGPQDLDRPIYLGHIVANLIGTQTATIAQVLDALRQVYCGPIGAEFMHVQDPAQRNWLQARLEGDNWRAGASAEQKKVILDHLTEAEGFEAFCQKRYVGTKRFGLEGEDVTIPALHAVIDQVAKDGVKSVAIGMPHRGRLNTLVNVVRKPYTAIFSEFAGASFKPDDVQGSGDVKYHLGTSTDVDIDGNPVHISLQPNPSHLEAVDPVVVGKVRAAQDGDDPHARGRHMALLLHGDAAFAGQGLVYETMAMSQLIGYRTGGTIHIVVNNQIGFTTVSAHAFSGLYCTDIAKAVQAPILHVNGDEPEAVVYCARLIADFRQKFATDIVLDVVGYRRHGHNESDEPAFTQPTMYKAIAARPTVRTLYADRLVREGVVTEAQASEMWDAFHNKLEESYQAAQTYKPNKADWLEGSWEGLKPPPVGQLDAEPATGVAVETLRKIGDALSAAPSDFNINPKIARQLKAKAAMFKSGEGIDWATGEALGFGSLLLEKFRVRLSGEDCQRGTFSQRHAVLIDQINQNTYAPLNNIDAGQGIFEVYNSLLSEFGVLGFEYGYSLADPNALVLWEGQFGDFANGAQVIIDQFIASGETKWLRMSGLVLLLPHGYEGQGPEHSSARLERFLQLCAENNMRVCNITTPANYFHALRRQQKLDYRKPLVIMTPKSLLRHKLAVSNLEDFASGTSFRPVIGEIDPIANGDAVERVVICSGKVYYDLLAERRERKLDKVAILRLEQFYPFPEKLLAEQLALYPKAQIIWCQEEPENMGGWCFVDRRIEGVMAKAGRKGGRPVYVGRIAAASPATGLARIHAAEQAALVNQALGVG